MPFGVEKGDGLSDLEAGVRPCNPGERRRGAVLEKEDGLSVLETGVRPCNSGERKWAFAVLEKGDRPLLSW